MIYNVPREEQPLQRCHQCTHEYFLVNKEFAVMFPPILRQVTSLKLSLMVSEMIMYESK